MTRHVMNRNLQVTREDYARCVQEQIEFLHQQEESTPTGRTLPEPDLAQFYDNSCSVDAAASDLFYRGF